MIKKLAISSFLMLSYSASSYAEDVAVHNDSHSKASHEALNGLPQLDPSSFESQTFWLIIIFTAMYVFFSKKSLPQISQSIELRSERINNDLDTAQQLKDEVSLAQDEYEKSLQGARSEASSLFTDIEDKLKAKAEKNTKDFEDRSIKKVSELEVKINDAKKIAMEDISQIAADIASQAAEKIIGVRTDTKSAKNVVNSINKAA